MEELQDIINPVPAEELAQRLEKFRAAMDKEHPGWEMAAIQHKIAMYYFTGTIQDGVLLITPDSAILWVRRSYERACCESNFPDIRSFHSYREVVKEYAALPKVLHIEKKKTTLDWLEFIGKYLPFEKTVGLDHVLQDLRLIKSPYEIELMTRSGKIHQAALEEYAPSIIREGISEAELSISVYKEMVLRGGHGAVRFNMTTGDETIGVAAFGKSGLVKTAFDGPGGCNGTCIAVQTIGRASRRLRQNQLVHMDIPCGVEGYHTDKTVIYYFGDLSKDPEAEKIKAAYKYCLDFEAKALELLRPGTVLEDLYLKPLAELGDIYGDAFMGGGKFLGHSVGLVIDELPVPAKGFKEILAPGMVFALEPKIALPGLGMVGTENTYLVTEDGYKCLTGGSIPYLKELK